MGHANANLKKLRHFAGHLVCVKTGFLFPQSADMTTTTCNNKKHPPHGFRGTEAFCQAEDQIIFSSSHSKDEQQNLCEYTDALHDSSQNPIRKTAREVSFPVKLFEMLDLAEKDGLSHIISWQPHGRCFVMRTPSQIENVLMRYMPGLKKKRSFQRQVSKAVWRLKDFVVGVPSTHLLFLCTPTAATIRL
jgi:HSF-type DNA-binding